MQRRNTYLIRNLEDEGYLEAFLVSAVAAILLVRFYLYLTGFPQVGGKGLHVAHMLWGGVLMVAGIALLVNYLDRDARRLAIIVAGAGFGLFIDELGKFITSDNNYFFRPAASLIYAVFVLLYVLLRLLQRERNVTEREYLINSIEALKEAVVRGYDRSYIDRSHLYLDRSRPSSEIADGLHALLTSCPEEYAAAPSRWQQWRERSRRTYARVSQTRWFPRAVVAFFLLQTLVILAVAVVATALMNGFVLPSDPTTTGGGRHLVREADVLFAASAAGLVLAGAVLIFRSRLAAYRMFKAAMLVSIFLTEIFEFYDIQFGALYGLACNIVGLLLVNTLIARERDVQRRQVVSAVDAGGGGRSTQGRSRGAAVGSTLDPDTSGST